MNVHQQSFVLKGQHQHFHTFAAYLIRNLSQNNIIKFTEGK